MSRLHLPPVLFKPKMHETLVCGADVNTKPLSDLADVRSGHPFRGAIQADPEGDVRVVQMRDVTEGEPLDWDQVTRTRLPARAKPDWLEDDDILLVARGHRLFSVHLGEVPEKTVPGPQFIRIRVKTEADRVRPAFLAWQLNRRTIQDYITSMVTGTHLPVITVAAASGIPVAIPSVAEQVRIIELERQVREQIRCYEALIKNRVELMDAVAYAIRSAEDN